MGEIGKIDKINKTDKTEKIELIGLTFVYIFALGILITRSVMTVSTIFVIVAALFLYKEKKEEFLNNENYFVIGIIGLATIFSFFTDGGSHSAYLVIKKSLRFMPIIFFPIFLNKFERIKIFILMSCISLVINFYKGIQIYIKHIMGKQNFSHLRYESFTAINESAYAILGISFVILGMFIYYIKTKDKKMIFTYMIFYIISILIVILTKTRGAWIFLILGLGIFILYLNKKLFIYSILLGMLTIGIVLKTPVFQKNNYVRRIKSIRDKNDDSTRIRIIFWKTGIDISKDYPIFGVGKRNSGKFFTKYMEEKKSEQFLRYDYSKKALYGFASEGQTHNMYVNILVEHGIIVFLLELFFILYITYRASVFIFQEKIKRKYIYLITLGALIGTISFYFSGVFEKSIDNFKILGIYMLSIVTLLSCIRLKAPRKDIIKKNIELKDVNIIDSPLFYDGRGIFFEKYNKRDFYKIGIDDEFVQDNISISKKGVLRGLHLQMKKSQSKLITVIKGRVLDIVVDVRKDSPTYGKYTAIELNAFDKKSIYIPKGVAHGFLAIEDDTIVSYKCGDYYDPEDEIGIQWDDKTLNIDWELEKYNIQEYELILSKKDSNNITFEEFDKRFKEEQ